MPANQTVPRRKASGITVRIGAAIGAAAVLVTVAACGQTEPDLPGPPSSDNTAPEELTGANVDAWLDDTLPKALDLSVFDLFMNFEITALDDGRLYFEVYPGTGEPAVYEQIGESTWQEAGGDRTVLQSTERTGRTAEL